MKIGIYIKPLQPPALRNFTTHPIIAHIEELQKIHSLQPHRKLPVDHVVIHVQRYQAGWELHLAHVKRQQVPRNVHHLCRFVGPEKHGGVAFQTVPLQFYSGRVFVR